ncbi:cobalt ABC transporter substrate-binding protein CbiN [Corynebacterium sp. HMSC073H12]|uniref:energy-coupling factor ABC transporter substrate-binding protein n=1 Tax=Corynebacterium sp. HMSC073H12 TaxID=1715187 RepID=UPI0008A9AB56|nr:energy-coupling factor ABC transporter substrate-binding protein [Corynebacterium sp. HMSC073H12]OHQ76609.1 cobalt ABC transporter substrate-binding protein CbiN [Corynebacterium sp. HMSC073H12]
MNAKNNAQIVDAQAASQPKKNSVWVSVGLIVLVVVIAMFPLFFNYGGDAEEPFAGTDATATETIQEIDPNYEPWFEPLVGELPGEVESGLFALQAVIGAGVLFYVIGFYRGKAAARSDKREKEQ